MRLFIAIELPSGIKNAISGIQDKIKTLLPEIRLVKPDNLHLTLKFLGEIPSSQKENINQIITETAEKTPDFKIKLDALGRFPDKGVIRIIWIGASCLPRELERLREELETKFYKIGLPKEKRAFRAHITIGRLKQDSIVSGLKKEIVQAKTFLACQNLIFNTQKITLFQSAPGKDGPAYTALKTASLKII